MNSIIWNTKLKENYYLCVTFFCHSITLGIFCVFYVSRIGFLDKKLPELLLVFGFSLFVQFLPHAISSIWPEKKTYHNQLWLPVILIFIISIFAFIFPAIISYYLSFVFIVLGVLLYLFAIRDFVLFTQFKWKYAFIFGGLLFGFFVAFVLFSIIKQSIFIESLVARNATYNYAAEDTLYHSAIIQMIKNYGIPSTGIDGVPYTPYHFGFHWIIAQLSMFFRLSAINAITIIYPLLIIPLFFQAFFFFTLDLQKTVFNTNKLSLISWITFLCIFIGVPNHAYAGGYSDYYSPTNGYLQISALIHESYVLALMFCFVLGSYLIRNWEFGLNNTSTSKSKIFFIVIVPVAVAVIGLTKISTLFILVCCLGYLFLRLKLYKKLIFLLSFGIVVTVSLGAYILTVETLVIRETANAREGLLSFLHFYTLADFRPFEWVVQFFMWTYLFVFLFFLSTRDKHNNKAPRIVVEACMIVALGGIIPGLFIEFYGVNSIYFASIQLYFSCSLLFAFIPFWQTKVDQNKVFKILSLTMVIGLSFLLFKEIRYRYQQWLTVNVNVRKLLLSDPSEITNKVSISNLETYTYFKRPVQAALDTNKVYVFFKRLILLDTISGIERKKTVIYLNNYETVLQQRFNCIEKTLVAQALSGFARIEGMPNDCHIHNYGEYLYESNFGVWEDLPREKIYERAKVKNFNYIILYDNKKQNFSHFSGKK